MMNKSKKVNKRNAIMLTLTLLSASIFRNALADETHMWPVLTQVNTSSTGESATLTWVTYPVRLTEAELEQTACNQGAQQPCILTAFNRLDKNLWPGATQDLTNYSTIMKIEVPSIYEKVTWRKVFAANTFTSGMTTVRSPNRTLHGSCFRIGIIGTALYQGTWPTSYPWSNMHTMTFVPPGVAPVNSVECIGTPPANEWCAPETKSLDFDFGTLSLSEISTIQRKRDIVIKCTSDVKFKLNLYQQNEMPGSINLSNGLKAVFKVGGTDLVESIHQGIDGAITLSLTATLTGEADSTGFFDGSGVIGISYP